MKLIHLSYFYQITSHTNTKLSVAKTRSYVYRILIEITKEQLASSTLLVFCWKLLSSVCDQEINITLYAKKHTVPFEVTVI